MLIRIDLIKIIRIITITTEIVETITQEKEAIRTVIIITLEMEGTQEIKITTITITIDQVDTKTIKIIIIIIATTTKSITERKIRTQKPFRIPSMISSKMIPKLKKIFQAETFKKIEIKITIAEKKETTIEITKIARTTTMQLAKMDIITLEGTTFIIKEESTMVLREAISLKMLILQLRLSKKRMKNN